MILEKSTNYKIFSIFVAAVAITGLLTSCSKGSKSSVQSKRFETVLEMRDAYIEAGGDCPNWELSTVSLAIGSGQCSGESVLSIYSSRTIADEQNSAMKAFMLKTVPGAANHRLTLLVGENWILNDSDSNSFYKFKMLYGGDVVSNYSQIP